MDDFYALFGITAGDEDEKWNLFREHAYACIVELDERKKELRLTPAKELSFAAEDQREIGIQSPAVTIGRFTLKLLKKSQDADSQIVKAENKNTRKSRGGLSREILSQLKRLKIELDVKRAKEAPVIINNLKVPNPVKMLLSHASKHRFQNDDNSDLWVWSLELRYVGMSRTDRALYCFLRKNADVACFGYNDGGNDYLLVKMNSRDPSDPWVFKLNHEDFEVTSLPKIRLSEFLASLQIKDKK